MEIQNISYIMDGKTILKDLDFYILMNSVNILIGPNGSGKTSLLEVIAGIRKTDIKIDNSEMLYLNLDYLTLDKLTAEEFIKMIIDINKTNNYEIILKKFKELKIDDFLNTKIEYLSLGQKQKLLVLVGILSKKNILLFDEPYNGLDKESKLLMNRIFDEFKGQKTFFFATHDVDIVYEITDHVIELASGIII